ncbi:MAG: 50S ribosomal protein L18 [Bacteroidetes bacterium]|nr:50S ribosomal protein L18 [Bacteroidota bacterium]
MALKKSDRRVRIKHRIRKRISGTAETPRLCVFRSNAAIYAQLVDDKTGKTLAAASSLEKGFKANGTKSEVSHQVGKAIAVKAKAAGIESVVFDRGGYLYHGRVKSLAEGAREGGLKF